MFARSISTSTHPLRPAGPFHQGSHPAIGLVTRNIGRPIGTCQEFACPPAETKYAHPWHYYSPGTAPPTKPIAAVLLDSTLRAGLALVKGAPVTSVIPARVGLLIESSRWLIPSTIGKVAVGLFLAFNLMAALASAPGRRIRVTFGKNYSPRDLMGGLMKRRTWGCFRETGKSFEWRGRVPGFRGIGTGTIYM